MPIKGGWITKEEKVKFSREIDVWNFRLQKLYTEFNQKNNELKITDLALQGKLSELEKSENRLNQIALSVKELTIKSEQVLEQIGERNRILTGLDTQIQIKTSDLNDLWIKIDDRIEANKKKEEEALKGIREEIKQANEDLSKLNSELDRRKEEIKIQTKEMAKVVEELEEVKKELNKTLKEMEIIQRDTEQKNSEASSRNTESNEREKLLNFYSKRLQRWAEKLNVSLKEI